MKRRGSKNSKYVFAEQVNAGYCEIGHDIGSIIWFVDNKGKMHEKVSKAGMDDFHTKLMGNHVDDWWRGRASADKGGAVTVLPPVRIRAKGGFDLPDDLFNALTKRFKPKFMLVDTAYEGLKRVALKKKEEIK